MHSCNIETSPLHLLLVSFQLHETLPITSQSSPQKCTTHHKTNTPIRKAISNLDLHRLGRGLLRNSLLTRHLRSLPLHAANRLRLARAHQQEHHHRNHNNHHNHNRNNAKDRHAEAARLLPLAVLLAQHARSLLTAHVAALQRALVLRHLAHGSALEHALTTVIVI